jgi:biofilm PGA synthesis N-glycosyltransferase PgaC
MFIVYVLFGYPLALAALSRRRRLPPATCRTPRTVSIVIPVHNGERWIGAKINTIAALEYPADLIEVIFVDDGSTDQTVDVLRRLCPSHKIVSIPRSGKAAALNAGINIATGEILFLTDIRQRLDPMSLRYLIECFGDPRVGVASGELIILSGETQEEANIGLYWRYEKWIRERLSQIDSVPGATGSVYAIRR